MLSLIIQLIAGVIGGNSAGAALKQFSLGPIGNSIAGLLGGVGGGQLLGMIIPALSGAAANGAAAAGGGMDIGALAGQLVGGGVSGAILTLIVGFIKQKMAGTASAPR